VNKTSSKGEKGQDEGKKRGNGKGVGGKNKKTNKIPLRTKWVESKKAVLKKGGNKEKRGWVQNYVKNRIGKEEPTW